FAISMLLQNGARLLISPRAQAVPMPGLFTQNVFIGDLRVKMIDLITIAVSLLLLALMNVFLRRTLLGVTLRAAAQDFTMTRLVGIRADAVIAAAFGISGLIAGIVALFWIGKSSLVEPTV